MTEETTTIAETAESPSKNGLGTYLGLAIIVLTALATAAATIAGDADTAKLTGVLAVAIGGSTQFGKYAQAFAKILATAKSTPELGNLMSLLQPPSLQDEEDNNGEPEVDNSPALEDIEIDDEETIDPETTTKPDLPLEDIDNVNGGEKA